MFLIQYDEGEFRDGEQIDYIRIEKDKIVFTLHGDLESEFPVHPMMHKSFLNQLQAINDNVVSVASFYSELDKGGL